MWCVHLAAKYIDTKHQHQTRRNNEVIDYYKI